MIKYFVDKWNQNENYLKQAIENSNNRGSWHYIDLVKLVVENILNNNLDSSDYEFDSKYITEIDNGDRGGTLLYLIPRKWYQPAEYEYIMTFVDYGSCSQCDALKSISETFRDVSDEQGVKECMELCKDLVCNMIKPYNSGWREDAKFCELKME